MKNKLMKKGDSIIRVLDEKENKVFVIDCIKKTMPYWCDIAFLDGYELCLEDVLTRTEESLSAAEKRIMHERYTLIAGILPFVSDEKSRSMMISKVAEQYKVSKQTIRKYLCLYLVYQDISVLAPDKKENTRELTADEKNIRWALNKFFYTKNKNSLKTAYTMMLKEKYCDSSHNLLPDYPTFYQFRYYYRKHRSLQKFYISRDGLSDYQRNSRPLTGNGIQEFASSVGIGMLDSTICDIYLVNESGGIVGRPLLTVCIDAYSSLCLGYTLSWEGGVYSLTSLMTNVIANKQEWCSKFGIEIERDEWNCNSIPATLVTDMGSEYKGETFEQIAELGISVVNLPPYRPELKGAVEKFFDLIQEMYKPYLKNRGVIEIDYQERGVRDYRKDACLTLEDFEKVILRCIIFYNTKRIIDNFPYTDDMLISNVKPYANCIWNYGKTQAGANLINVNYRTLVLTLLPRTEGKFSRFGLKVNKLRYTNDNYTEAFLKGGSVTVAFNPDDVSSVWIIEKGNFIEFELIESQYKENTLTENTSEKIQSNEKIVTEEKIVREDLKIEVADNIQSTYGLMRVHFIDVGQGDCSFIELGNGQTMLIDAGNNENGDEIVKYIKDLQYRDIDYVVATHPHEDHIGGMTEIIENFDIDIFYMPWAVSTSYTYENMIDTLSEKRVEVHKAELGRTILSSGPIEITVLSPDEDTVYSDLNDASAVVRLQYGETVFLFTGDTGEVIEEDLCDFNIDSDVLKVGHHGSETSSSEAFIQKVSPEIAVISCGENNSYGHPDEITLDTLKEYDADIYRTDESGTIIVTADQNKKISVDKKASPIKEKAPPTVVSEVKEEEIIEKVTDNAPNENYIVYRTATGKNFHLDGCSYLKSKYEITIEEAQRRGLTPCSRCRL